MKWKALFAALAVAVLLTGCTEKTPETPDIPATEAAQTVPKPTSPIQALSCLTPEAVPDLLDLGGGSAVLCWQDFREKQTYLATVDTLQDTILREITIPGSWTLEQYRFTGGKICLTNPAGTRRQFYDADLTLADSQSSGDEIGILTADCGKFYSLADDMLIETDIRTGSRREVLPELRVSHLVRYVPEENKLILGVFLSPYRDDLGMAEVDLTRMCVTALQERIYRPIRAAQGTGYLCPDEDWGISVLYPEEGGYRFADASLFPDNGSMLWSISGSDYYASAGERPRLYHLEKAVSVCDLQTVTGELISGTALEENGSLLLTAWDGSRCTLYLVDPAQLDFQPLGDTYAAYPLPRNLDLETAYAAEAAGTPVADYLQDLRREADALEQKYGIVIRMGEQCAQPGKISGYDFHTTASLPREQERSSIRQGLDQLERCLQKFPENFFPQFQKRNPESGIQILFTGVIDAENRIIGCSYPYRQLHILLVDVTQPRLEGTICHEIWHAMEDHIQEVDPSALSLEAWNKLNPDGFQYDEDLNLNASESQRWTYFRPEEGIYFVDSYAKTNPREDRARIFEYIMAEPIADSLMESSAIREKLRQMADSVRKNFDTTVWETPTWERYFDET